MFFLELFSSDKARFFGCHFKHSFDNAYFKNNPKNAAVQGRYIFHKIPGNVLLRMSTKEIEAMVKNYEQNFGREIWDEFEHYLVYINYDYFS